MIKKSLKYFVIVAINMIVLTLLLALWTDVLQIAFDPWVRPMEFLTIIGLTLICLIGMRILIWIMNKKVINDLKRKKIIFSIILTLTLSSFHYGKYSMKVSNVLFNKSRKSLMEKIEYPSNMLNGITADSLTYVEYNALAKEWSWPPELPETAKNIWFEYSYDGFLPDYSFQLKYEMPLKPEINQIIPGGGDIKIRQTVQIKEDVQLVTYSEVRQ